jgi:hypothetical protein
MVRLLALEPDAREHEIGVLAESCLVAPREKKTGQERGRIWRMPSINNLVIRASKH